MNTTYRACYYANPDEQTYQTVLTRPDQAHLSDAALIEAAVQEAYEGDIVSKDGDANRVSEKVLRANLHIGAWTEI